eukprot:gene6153-11546_t
MYESVNAAKASRPRIVAILTEASLTEERLLKKIFEGYDQDARPVLNDKDNVTVIFGMSVRQIIDIHEKSQILITSAWTRQKWKNPFLSWDPKLYNGITSVNVRPSKIWLPDIVLYNNADEDKSFGGNLDRLNTRVILSFDGTTVWLAPVILKSKCEINVKYFPFDEQRCKMKFGSWTYDEQRLNLVPENYTADLKKYLPNAEWHLDGIPARRNLEEYSCCPEKYPDVTFTVEVRRRSLFYLCNLIFPMTIIGMLTMLSFLLPAESGERISLAITLLLAMTVFMLVVADIIPATSEVIPLVGVFFSAAMVEMVIMIIVLCYVMRLYHKEPEDPPMPWWMRKYVLDWLSYKVKVRKQEETGENDNEEYVQMLPFQRRSSVSEGSGSAKEEDNKDLQLWVRNTMPHKNSQTKSDARHCKHGFSGHDRSSSRSGELAAIAKKLDFIVERLRGEDDDSRIKSEWRIVAMTIDYCLLHCFVILLLLTIIICFSNSPGYVP